ncbi:tyrosine-type recombinase/integrase [Klebsiella aerogenes]|uniref:tyrosine-type recombinase/integrase n=1 Tax=Klebsiella aerogenes TaxID=548 RepID=UPI001D0D6477|nr:tyrosine-type recombinase/integrase [Klebsiella aerogenes]
MPLSTLAIKVVEELLNIRTIHQQYLIAHKSNQQKPMRENTINKAIKNAGYDGMLTGHGIRGAISTELNELGYPKEWIEAQLSHKDPNKVRAAYNHAQYVEQRCK